MQNVSVPRVFGTEHNALQILRAAMNQNRKTIVNLVAYVSPVMVHKILIKFALNARQEHGIIK